MVTNIEILLSWNPSDLFPNQTSVITVYLACPAIFSSKPFQRGILIMLPKGAGLLGQVVCVFVVVHHVQYAILFTSSVPSLEPTISHHQSTSLLFQSPEWTLSDFLICRGVGRTFRNSKYLGQRANTENEPIFRPFYKH